MMLFVIKDSINDEAFESIKNSSDREITLDLSEVKYLSSKEITKILVLIKEYNKKVIFINCNFHINETIKVLNLNGIIEIKN